MSTRDAKQNFAKRDVAGHDRVGLGNLFEGQHAIDDRRDAARGEPRADRSFENLCSEDLLFERACTKHGADNCNSTSQNRAEIEFTTRACGQTDKNNPGILSAGREGLIDVRAAHKIEDNIDASTASGLFYGVREFPVGCVDAMGEPARRECVELA